MATTHCADKAFFGHPKGLAILFFAEMWERFSFYGMRGLLIIYLTQHFLFSDQRSAAIFGAYSALAYVMTIIGGTLADRYLGQRKAVTFGAILLILGHFGMAFEGEGSRQIMTFKGARFEIVLDGRGGDARQWVKRGDARSAISYTNDGTTLQVASPDVVGLPPEIDVEEADFSIERQRLYEAILYLSLALLITGVGYLKANISTIVGALYSRDDPRRDSGFTIFYMGINLGSFLSSVTCGILGIVYGWRYGFGLAGIGMAAGLAVFLYGQKYLEGRAEPPSLQKLKSPVLGFITVEWACYLAGLLIIAVSTFAMMNAHLVHQSYVGFLGIAILAFLVCFAIIKLRGAERSRMLAAIYFMIAQIPFWALFEQAGSSLNLFTDRLVDRSFFGWTIAAPVFQGLNAFYIFAFAPVFAWTWVWLSRRGWEPSAATKFAGGVTLVGLGFLALVVGIKVTGSVGLTPVLFIFLIYLLHTLGELLVSPVGLSAVTRLAPMRVVGLSMGAWFLYTGLSTFLAGVIAQKAGVETIGGQIIDIGAAKESYIAVYTNVGLIGIATGLCMFMVAPLITSLANRADEREFS